MNITSFPQCNYNVIIGNHRTDVCDQNILNILSTISNVAMKILATIFLDWIISFARTIALPQMAVVSVFWITIIFLTIIWVMTEIVEK